MAINLNNLFGGGGDVPAGWKSVRYAGPQAYSLRTSASSPTTIPCTANQRIRILLLADGNSMSVSSTGSAYKYKTIKLGNTTILSPSQYLTSYREGVSATSFWWGSHTERAQGVAKNGTSSVQVLNPTTYISSLGCPIGGPGEALTMWASSSTSVYRKVWLAYEILQKI